MRGLAALVAGAVLSSSLYAAEPTLHTTPDPGIPLVQENVDKALKVAYMVLGQACPSLSPSPSFEKGMPPNWREVITFGGGYLNIDGQVIGVYAQDFNDDRREEGKVPLLLRGSDHDSLTFGIYPSNITTIEQTNKIFGSQPTQIRDDGLDGNVNYGYEIKKGTGLKLYDSKRSLKRNDFSYFQDTYLKALDKIIAACEGAK